MNEILKIPETDRDIHIGKLCREPRGMQTETWRLTIHLKYLAITITEDQGNINGAVPKEKRT